MRGTITINGDNYGIYAGIYPLKEIISREDYCISRSIREFFWLTHIMTSLSCDKRKCHSIDYYKFS